MYKLLKFVPLAVALFILPAYALDGEHWNTAEVAINRGISYLRQTQGEDGSWSPRPGPAVTALVISVMLERPDISDKDLAVVRALNYVLSKCKEDGGIHDGILQNYNTAICLSALSRVGGRQDVAEAASKAQWYLRQLQWHDQADPHGKKVDPSHPFYGGAGYGRHGRPDLSNTQIMLQGLYDSGLSCEDPAFQRALVFITRCQGTQANTQLADRIVPDGGFIYSTSIDRDQIGMPQSMAGSETDHDGEVGPKSRLRTYGSMTYAGFKTYVYANLSREDPRVVDAFDWIRRYYTVNRNPGMPENRGLEGYYYYLMTMARALDAWGATFIKTPDEVSHDWANDLIDRLTELQRDDGSWVNGVSRWMEADANLVTAYALIALTHTLR